MTGHGAAPYDRFMRTARIAVVGGGPAGATCARALARAGARVDPFEAALHPLWVRAQAGDESAYRDALHRMAVRLRVYLRQRLRGLPDEVEDLVQEILLALHLQRGSYDPALPVSAWMLLQPRFTGMLENGA